MYANLLQNCWVKQNLRASFHYFDATQRYWLSGFGHNFGEEKGHILEKGMATHSSILAWRIP